MLPLGYARPPTYVSAFADNFMFRVVFGAAGLIWNGLLILLHLAWGTGSDVEQAIAGARLRPFEAIPARTQFVLDAQLHRATPMLVIVLLVLLGGVAIGLIVHACRHARADLIPWPRWYWLAKAVLVALLLAAVWGQYELYTRIGEDLEPWTDLLKNPAPDSRFENVCFAVVGSIFGLLPVLSCVRQRKQAL